MAITVTPNMTDISLCQATTGWSSGGTSTDFPLEGTTCLGIQVKNTTSALITYQPYTTVNTVSRARASNVATIISGTHSLSVGHKFTMRSMADVSYNGNWVVKEVVNATTFTYDCTGGDEGTTADIAGRIIRAIDLTGQHLYVWLLVTGVADTKALGGYRVYAETDSTNNKTWYVAGNDTHPGGWGCFVVDPNSTPTTPVGTLVLDYITKIGVRFKTISTIQGTAYNCFWDAVRMGTGITVTSADADAITLESIYAYCNDVTTRRWGVITKGTGNTYIIQGLIIFGGTGAEIVDFVDKNQIILFPDNLFVSDTFYGIKVLRGSGVVNFVLGEKSGTAGIKGCVLKSIGTKLFSFDVSDVDNNKIQLYGNTFSNAGVISLPPTAANNEVLSCAFDTCSEMVVSTCVVKYCNFISATAAAIKISSTSHNVTESNFISCVNGVLINVVSTYTFDKLMFTNNNPADVNNTSGSTIIVQKANGSNPTTQTGSTVTFVDYVPVVITVKTVAGVAIENAQCAIYKLSDNSQIMNKDTLATGIASDIYIGSAPVNIYWRVRKSSTPDTKYVPQSGNGEITVSGFSVAVTLVEDTNA